MTTTSIRPLRSGNNVALIVGGLLAAAVLAAVVFALTFGRSDSATTIAVDTVSQIPQGETLQFSAASVLADPLPPYEAGMVDSAIGTAAPGFEASFFNNAETRVEPGDGTPRIILFVAHWCAHCQEEVSTLATWFAENGVPSDIEILAVSTAVDPGTPNYPPSEWLLREKWPTPVLRDSVQQDLAIGFGLRGFPYQVAIDGDGTIVSRNSGTLDTAQWESLLDSVR